jgi:DNA repair photolyase
MGTTSDDTADRELAMRWQDQRTETLESRQLPGYRDAAAVRTFKALPARDTRFYEVQAKTALNRVPGRRTAFRWTINPYRGCSHSCVYCYARPTHEYLGFDAGREFEHEIVVKVNVADALRAELRRPSWKGELVALGTNTDPYQWAEGHYRLMRGIWEAMRDHSNPATILTRSPLLTRDIDLMKQIADRTDFTAYLSIPTLDQRAWRATEPRSPNPRARLDAMHEIAAAGIPVGIVIAPLLPGINDDPEQIDEIIQSAERAGAVSIDATALHLRGSTKTVFMDWLQLRRPDLVDRYRELYGSGSEMAGEEQRRLKALVGARGHTWEQRVRELNDRERESKEQAASPVQGKQTTLF